MRWIVFAVLLGLALVLAVFVRGGARPGAETKAPPTHRATAKPREARAQPKKPRDVNPRDHAPPTSPDASSDATPNLSTAEANETAPERRVAPPVPDAPVVLFEHATHDGSFPGRWWEVWQGTTNAGDAFPNDQASAVDVPTGYQVTLFSDADEGGARIVLAAGRHNLAPYALNDSVSSVRVARKGQDPASPSGPEDRVVLFEHTSAEPAQRGEQWELALDDGNTTQLFTSALDFGPRAVSAAWVPLGQELTLFHEPDGRGLAMVLGPGYHELALVGFNDRALSARLRRTAE